jgi:carbon storage regulator
MLVLERKLNEKIFIGDDIITVARIDGFEIRLGIEAPKDMWIDREELRQRIKGRVRTGVRSE